MLQFLSLDLEKNNFATEQIRVEKAYFFKDCVMKCIKRVSSNESLS